MKNQQGMDEKEMQEILAMFEGIPTVEEVNARMAERVVDLETDPEFVADYLKARFVEDVFKAMDEQGLNKHQLAKKLGKSRQYVGRVLNEKANFTFERIAEFACGLEMRVGVRLYTPEERMLIVAQTRKPTLHLLTEFETDTKPFTAPMEEPDAGNVAA